MGAKRPKSLVLSKFVKFKSFAGLMCVLKYFKFLIFVSTRLCRPLKYQRSTTPLVSNNKGIRKLEFEASNQFKIVEFNLNSFFLYIIWSPFYIIQCWSAKSEIKRKEFKYWCVLMLQKYASSWELLWWLLIIPIVWSWYPLWGLLIWGSGYNYHAGYVINIKLICRLTKYWY